MNLKKETQYKAALNIAEKQMKLMETANEQLEGTLRTFTLIMASIALKFGGTFELTAAEIDVASGVEFRIEKDDKKEAIILRAGDAARMEPVFDPGEPPSKLQNPFIMEDETTLNGPQPVEQPRITTTDL
jgi:hypothetical protein